MNFEELGLNAHLIRAITLLGFETPTPIQQKAIPILLSGTTDFVGLAQTGTGKTAAFGLPLLQLINVEQKYPQALIICPTRELCLQICNDFQDEKVNPLVNGVMMLTGALRRHKSIIDLSLTGNKYLPVTVNDWMGKGIITPANKPNILYVDVAGEWITDYCLLLNQTRLYTKP